MDEMGLNDSEGSVPSLACRGLGMQRSIKSQALTLHRGPIVLHSQSIANPHKARAFCLCVFHLAGFLLLLVSTFYWPRVRLSAKPPSSHRCRGSSGEGPRSVYLLAQPSRQTPAGCKVATLDCLTAPKRDQATADSLSYYLGQRPAVPLTLSHCLLAIISL